MPWLLLILTLPTENATARMRAWRALKVAGAAVLRDGVYLLPERAGHADALNAIAVDVRDQGGVAHVLRTEHDGYEELFDRGDDYARLLAEVASCRAGLAADTAAEAMKQVRRLRKTLEQLQSIDFFAGEALRQATAAVDELDSDVRRLLAPDEPHAATQRISRLRAEDYHGRVWATRRRPWVDRLASAWLIRRFIDPQARFVWLKTVADRPKKAIGFDFDGATFSHVGARVTFETLLASFGLETPALLRLGALVHGLDAGGVLPPEAAGVERVLAGMRDSIADDDQLVLVANGVFEGLLASFEKDLAS